MRDLTACVDISQPAVSQHLATLRDADWIRHYRAFWTWHVDRLEDLQEKMDA